jgi:S-adenosylmethionine hydrolase
MSDALITLTTDFGQASPYVAALKGAILGVNPLVRILDLSHDIPAQDFRAASFFLASAIPYFPAGPIHVVVVDPGVGTDRALLYVEAGQHRLLAPDNGCWTELARHLDAPPRVIRLNEPGYWRGPLSATFHGRDILAPVAAWLSLNLDPDRLGPRTTEWVDLRMPAPELKPDYLKGEVVFVDRFGNLITNIPGQALASLAGSTLHVLVGNHHVSQVARAYGDAPPGTLIALVSSGGTLEVAVTQGNAARRLGVGVGERVEVRTTD